MYLKLFLVLLCFVAPSVFSLDFWENEPAEVLAQKIVDEMTVSELAGQALMYGFPSDTPSEETLSWVRERNLGGIKIFGWNATSPAAVALAVRTLQAQSQKTRFRIPLLVATDQEGGWVRHIKGSTSPTPGNLAIGASGIPFDAFETGYYLGLELKQMGVNMNFAPSIDLYTNPNADVIGPRSFSQNPVQTGILGSAFMKGLMKAGVVPTAKHFPGHGDTALDSHGKLPILSSNLEQLEARELVPYRMLIKEGLPAVMTGHLAFPQITGDNIPASLSAGLTQNVLREKLGFTKMVITDDLFMEGARPVGWTPQTTAQNAIKAGNDMLLLSQPATSQWSSYNALVSLAQSSPAFLAQLKRAALHVLQIKLQFLKGPNSVPIDPKPSSLVLPNADGKSFFFQQALRSATVLKTKRIPWAKDSQQTLVITPYDSFFQAFKAWFPGSQKLEYDFQFYGSDKTFLQLMTKEAKNASRIVFNFVTPGSLDYLRALKPFKDKLVVVSLLSPVYLKDEPWVDDALAVYGTYVDSFEAAAALVAGDFKARGRLPVRFGDFPWTSP